MQLSNVLYAWGSKDDRARSCLNFVCPQVTFTVQNNWKKMRLHSVFLRDFPVENLADCLLPETRERLNLTDTDGISVYFGLLRFREKFGFFPLTVKCRTLDDDWETFIGEIVWEGVRFSSITDSEIEEARNVSYEVD